MRVYDRSGEAEPLLPQIIAERAEDLGWEEIWQLTYCQWCAGYAHESSRDMVEIYWEDPDLGDARQVWGPSPRSIFSVVDQDEAAWVIDGEYKYPVIGLYETRLVGWWQYAFAQGDDYEKIAVPRSWEFFNPDNLVGTNNLMSESEKVSINAFWRSLPETQTLLKLQESCIQVPFLTRGAFAQFRDALYKDEDDPALTDRFADDLNGVLYEGPLYQFWKEILIDNDYTWPPNAVQLFSSAYSEQVAEITRVMSEAYESLFQDEMPISPSSPVQPQEFVDNPLAPFNTNPIINRSQDRGDTQDVLFDIMKPLVFGTGTLEIDDKGHVVLVDRT